jgi:hypothetical protein
MEETKPRWNILDKEQRITDNGLFLRLSFGPVAK